MTTTPEHVRARMWRENVVKLTRAELAPLVGFSPSRIADIEHGSTRGAGARPIDPDTWQRYRAACAAVTLGAEFDWSTCTIKPRAGVTITVGIQSAEST